MSYIKQEDRPKLDAAIEPLVDVLVATYDTAPKIVGPLNYALTRVFMGTLRKLTAQYPGERGYATLAAFGGVLSHVGMEVYRRFTAAYQDTKVAANGDVPEFEP